MKKLVLCCATFLVLSLFVQAKPIGKQEQKEILPTEFLRVKQTDKVVSGLEIAITRYESRDGKLKVDLVGVVHIGDGSYYSTLNRRLSKYEVVLYELVAPLGSKPAKKNDGLMPKMVGFLLDLESQLSEVNYDKKNFVHADMSFDEMMKVAAERGDDKLTLGLSIIADMLRQNNLNKGKAGPADEDIDFSKVIENPNLLKQKMVKQLVSTAETGPTLKKLLVEDRNKKVMQVLASEVKAGKKHIAIFYGAAHNSDFDKRLRSQGMVCVGQEWLVAWDNLDAPPLPTELRLLKMFMRK